MAENYFDYLPDEMVSMIFSYLAHRDMKSFRETCQRFKVLTEHIFTSSSVIVCTCGFPNEIIQLKDFMDEWMKTNIKCKNMTFIGVNFKEIAYEEFEKIFSHNLCEMEELKFRYCRVDGAWLVKILEQMPRIKRLRVGLWDLMTKQILDYAKIIKTVIDRVECLYFEQIPCLDRETMESISLDVEPKLKELYLLPNYSRNEFDDGKPPSSKSSGIYVLLKLVAKSLKIFRMQPIISYPDLLSTLYELNMNLEEIELHVDDGVYSDAEFERFFVSQTNLRILSLSGNRITDERAKFFCEKLIQLRRLELHDNDAITTEGVKCVTLLPELVHLRVDGLYNFRNTDARERITMQKKDRLKTLDLRDGEISNDTLIETINNFKQLSCLRLESNLTFSSELIPLIYENLPKLIELRIHRYYANLPPAYCVQHLQPPLLQSKDPRIFLLKRLKHLSLAGFSEIPGASLEDIAKLKELETLELESRKDLSLNGFKVILKNCYYLKSIGVQDFNNFITNDTEKTELAASFPFKRFSFKFDWKY